MGKKASQNKLIIYIIGVLLCLGLAIEVPVAGFLVFNGFLAVGLLLLLHPRLRVSILSMVKAQSPKKVPVVACVFLLVVGLMGWMISLGNMVGGRTPRETADKGVSATKSSKEKIPDKRKETGEEKKRRTESALKRLKESGVTLDFTVDNVKSRRPSIIGTTNLPDETFLMISVSSKLPDFIGQAKVQVKESKFKAGPFGPEAGLRQGLYEADVTMPIPSTQPKSVLAVIGKEGENLKGKLVEKGSLGTTVSKEKEFFIGNSRSAAVRSDRKFRKTALKEANAILKSLIRLEKQGRSMDPIRKTRDNTKLRRCGELMRKRQAQARELRTRADALPMAVRLSLSGSAASVEMCVSCLPSASDNCKVTRDFLKDARKEIREWK